MLPIVPHATRIKAATPTVVNAYVAPGSPPVTVEDGLRKILANL